MGPGCEQPQQQVLTRAVLVQRGPSEWAQVPSLHNHVSGPQALPRDSFPSHHFLEWVLANHLLPLPHVLHLGLLWGALALLLSALPLWA